MVTYLAVQCYHCKTMQAKQEKKSSNQWTCAICNHKQSLQKIFARSALAKDIRLFVQNFNISSLPQTIPLPQIHSPQYQAKQSAAHPVKHSKWAEYLDPQHHQNVASNADDDYDDAPFVTTLPDPPLRKRKRQPAHNSQHFSTTTLGKSLENYGFLLPNQKKIHGPANEEKPKNIINKIVQGNDSPSKERGEGGAATPTGCFVSEKVSKWASYLDMDSSDTGLSKCGSKDVENELDGGIIQPDWQDQVVDEDVHPDFL